jgi:hypothetical protein
MSLEEIKIDSGFKEEHYYRIQIYVGFDGPKIWEVRDIYVHKDNDLQNISELLINRMKQYKDYDKIIFYGIYSSPEEIDDIKI